MVVRNLYRVGIFSGLCVSLAIFAVTSTAFAEEDFIEISEAQLDLNEQGIRAVEEEDYERAIRLFRASLDLGELNITYVNLARVYQHAGDCQRANELYDEAMEAPRVDEPTPERIEAAIDTYRGEMEENCAGYLQLECTPEDMALFIDGLGPLRCHGDGPRELMPRTYEIRGEYLEFEAHATAEVTAMEHSTVELSLTEAELEELESRDEVAARIEEDADVLREFEANRIELDVGERDEDFADTPPMPGSSGTKGVMLLTAGALSLAGAVALDVVPDRASNGEFNTINFVAAGLYGTALGFGIFGIRSTW